MRILNIFKPISSNLKIFRKEFLNADSWEQRKDGPPLYLLDKLTPAELNTAETELIQSVNLGDSWRIIGLCHIKSTRALPALYKFLDSCNGLTKITAAHSIFQISQDAKMIDIVLEEVQNASEQELIEIVYMLPNFKNEKVAELLNSLRTHKDYLVAYNATRAMGLSTDDVVKRYRAK